MYQKPPTHGRATKLHLDESRLARQRAARVDGPDTYGWEDSYSAKLARGEWSPSPRVEPMDDVEYAFGGAAARDNRAEELAERADQRAADALADEWDRAHATPAPRPAPRPDPMSDRQRSYLADLIRTRGSALHRSLDLDAVDRVAASRMIDELRVLPIVVELRTLDARPRPVAPPPPAPLPHVSDGRYAVDRGDWSSTVAAGALAFYVVKRDAAGFVRVRAQASDALYEVRDYATKRAILAAIAVDPVAAAQRYGQELGVCACCGRTLTDESSRAFGLGPDCQDHFAARAGGPA